jgi:hypothetical protein
MVCGRAANRAGLSATAAEPDTMTILIVDDHRAFADLLSAA